MDQQPNNNLGLAYFYLSLHEDLESNCEKAVLANIEVSKLLSISLDTIVTIQIITNYLQANSLLFRIKFPEIRHKIKQIHPPGLLLFRY